MQVFGIDVELFWIAWGIFVVVQSCPNTSSYRHPHMHSSMKYSAHSWLGCMGSLPARSIYWTFASCSSRRYDIGNWLTYTSRVFLSNILIDGNTGHHQLSSWIEAPLVVADVLQSSGFTGHVSIVEYWNDTRRFVYASLWLFGLFGFASHLQLKSSLHARCCLCQNVPTGLYMYFSQYTTGILSCARH